MAKTDYPEDAIAITGISGRFPGASDLGSFWAGLLEGVCAVGEVAQAASLLGPAAPLFEPDRTDPNYVPVAPVIDRLYEFDPTPFGIKRAEMRGMDPQLRLLLECVWESLESSCTTPLERAGKVGVYCGMSSRAHDELMSLSGGGGVASGIASWGRGSAATQLAYFLDLNGEAVQVDTACSTGLVAMHLASESLLLRQCDVVVVACAEISPLPRHGYVYQKGMVFSPDGRCRAFDADARGTVPGAGAISVTLKLLEAALADRDPIHAVVRASAINSDGRRKVGFTAPSVSGQAEAIREALAYAELEPEDIGYVEAHGTGTQLGDPIEIAALNRVFGSAPEPYCGIGSVKTNIGHLGLAAGLAGLVKAAMVVKNGVVPPSLHFTRPNPELQLEGHAFRVVTERQPWPADSAAERLAGVSSFGIGGTNAHAIVQGAPERERGPEAPGARLVVFSAASEGALAGSLAKLAAHLAAPEDERASLAEIACTLATGRRAFEERAAVVVSSLAELRELSARGVEAAHARGGARRDLRVGLMFPGTGSESPGMARELSEAQPAFREALEAVLARVESGREELREFLLGATEGDDAPETVRIPALFTVQCAAAALLGQLGVVPGGVIGHSFGEYAAAVSAGVMSFEDALSLVRRRARLMVELPPGSMLALAAPAARVRELLPEGVVIAAENAKDKCTVSGSVAAIEELVPLLTEHGVASVALRTEHAFHSPDIDHIMPPLRDAASRVALSEPAIPMASGVSGSIANPGEVSTAEYWVRQMRQPVRFAGGIDALSERVSVFVEIGPGGGLTSLVRGHLRDRASHRACSLGIRSSRRLDASSTLLRALGLLFCEGAELDWAAVFRDRPRRVHLPTYAFERVASPPPYDVTRFLQRLAPLAGQVYVAPAEAGRTEPVDAAGPAEARAEAAPGDPEESLEATLGALVSEVLGLESVGPDEDFFDLGGSSLSAAQLLARVREVFGIELTVAEVFDRPTVAGLVAHLEESIGDDLEELERALLEVEEGSD